jgi:hypothetical protein
VGHGDISARPAEISAGSLLGGRTVSTEISFSSNCRDLREQHGTGAGFPFEFSRSRCSGTWRSPFEPFRAGQMVGWLSRA